MRNKAYGLSRLEINKMQSSKPLPQSKAIEILNLSERTRFQTEQAIKSLKYHYCQHILNFEMKRPSVSHSDYVTFANLVGCASQRLGIDIYTEYKEDYFRQVRGNSIDVEPKVVIYQQLGTQQPYAHMQY